VAQEDPDVVLIQHQPGLIGWRGLGETLLALAQDGRPVAVTLHNTASLVDEDSADRERAVSGLQGCARVIVHTLADIERLRAHGLSDNLVLIPHGGPEPGPAKPERTLLESDRVTIGCCGFLLPGKGIPTLVQAAARLRQRWPNLRLLLLNADYETAASHEEAARVREAIQEAGLEDAVDLVTDYLPFQEVRWRLSRCDAIVLPYPDSKEGASGALRMALSAGPCVAVTPIGFFDEAGEAVWRLPGSTPAKIAEGISTLLADQDARAFTKRAAADWLRARQWDAVGARTAGLLRGLAARPSGAPGR
jgi:glycosyltransferase involved in cell wall biosynthesis